MAKTVMKEVIITLLLILAIILVLAIFLYDYIPTSKIVPKIEQYEAPNNIKEELSQSSNEENQTGSPIVYEINNSDLKLYEKSKDYEKGKADPFQSDEVEENKINNTTNTNKNNTITNTTNNNTNKNTNSVGNYLPNTGTK